VAAVVYLCLLSANKTLACVTVIGAKGENVWKHVIITSCHITTGCCCSVYLAVGPPCSCYFPLSVCLSPPHLNSPSAHSFLSGFSEALSNLHVPHPHPALTCCALPLSLFYLLRLRTNIPSASSLLCISCQSSLFFASCVTLALSFFLTSCLGSVAHSA